VCSAFGTEGENRREASSVPVEERSLDVLGAVETEGGVPDNDEACFEVEAFCIALRRSRDELPEDN